MHRIYALLAFGSWFLLLWPFPNEVFLASCFACLLRPVYEHILLRCRPSFASAFMAIGLCIGIILPITIVVLMVTPQAAAGLQLLNGLQQSGWIQGPEMHAFIDDVDEFIRMIPGMEGGINHLTAELTSFLASAVQSLVSSSLGIAGSTMTFILRLCVLISLSLIGIIYAPHFFYFTKTLTRFPADVLQRLILAVRHAIRAVLWGVVLVACIQGFLCGVGFVFAGLSGGAFWGLVAAFVAPLPIIGTSIVWLPASIYIWFAVSKSTAVGLFLWCGIVVVGADNFLRPFFLRDGLNASFAVVLIAILCGLMAFGPTGIVAGPVLAAFALQAAREAQLADDTSNKTHS